MKNPEETGKGAEDKVGYCRPPKATRFGQPGANPSGNGRPRGASMKAAVLRELARDPDQDGIGRPVGEIAKVAVNRLRETKTFDTALYGRVSEQVDGKPSQSVQHSGTIHLVPMILADAPADMLELEGAADMLPEGDDE